MNHQLWSCMAYGVELVDENGGGRPCACENGSSPYNCVVADCRTELAKKTASLRHVFLGASENAYGSMNLAGFLHLVRGWQLKIG